MVTRAPVFTILAPFTFALLLLAASPAEGDVLYADDFEGCSVGVHPPFWGEISGFPDDVVTDVWSAGGDKSFVTVSQPGGLIRHPVLRLIDVGAWPLPDSFSYEAALHLDSTPGSSGMIGFIVADPRYAGHVPCENGVAFRLDGKIMWYGPASLQIGNWFPGAGQTFIVRVDIDFSSLSADVYLNGAKVAGGLPAWPKTIPADSVYGEPVPLDKWGFGVAHAFAGGEPASVFIDDVSLLETGETPAVPAGIKIRPKTINLRSRGRYITVYIDLDGGLDARNINVSTVSLRRGYSGPVYALAKPVSARDYDLDGTFELMVKFPRQSVHAILEPAQSVTLTVSGHLFDGTAFEGSDFVRVTGPGR
ncbi:MAG: hypothetical protein ACYTAN_13175 [Planctomycetota bacterium]|jgi:hypothetical protein